MKKVLKIRNKQKLGQIEFLFFIFEFYIEDFAFMSTHICSQTKNVTVDNLCTHFCCQWRLDPLTTPDNNNGWSTQLCMPKKA